MLVKLVPYDPNWKKLFEEEKVSLQKIWGKTIVGLEHIGSTAIPGIYAKPVIDILLGVKSLEDVTSEKIHELELQGYEYSTTFEAEFPNRRFFRKNNQNGERAYHIHVVNFPSSWWEKHILFRDYLRRHPHCAKKYESVKLELAQHLIESVPYALAKTDICQQIGKEAYHDFSIHPSFISTKRFKAYLPQLACLDEYTAMLKDQRFIACYGVEYDDTRIQNRLLSDMNHWDQFSFGPFMWYDKENFQFVGRAGIKKFELEGKPQIELTYALKPDYWGVGAAVEMGQAAKEVAFNHLLLDDLICFTQASNQQSLRVMEKLNFQYEKDFSYAGLTYKLHRCLRPDKSSI